MKKFRTVFNYFCFLLVCVSAKYSCNSGTVFVKPNKISFFETTNYPELMPIDKFNSCNLKFSLNSSNANQYRLYVAYADNSMIKTTEFAKNTIIKATNVSELYPMYGAVIKIWNVSSYNLQPFTADEIYIAQQGMVTFFNSNDDGCPLEYLNPLKLTDETETIYIQSSYDDYFDRRKSCNWIYTAPDGYGFKIYIRKSSNDTRLLIRNSTQTFLNERSVTLYYPYYNSDSYIHISLAPSDSTYLTDMEFQAYIGIVKNDAKKNNDSCIFTEHGNVATWMNNPLYGLKNNGYCFHNYTIPVNHIVEVSVGIFGLEMNVDFIEYIIDGTEYIITASMFFSFFVQSDKNSSKNMMFKFFSDGSLQSTGFQISFTKNECKCASSNIPCDGKVYQIMPNTNIYCGDLNCSFTISRCPSTTTLLTIDYETQNYEQISVTAVLVIKSDGNIALEINNDNIQPESVFVYMNSSMNNIIEATTYLSPQINSFQFSVQPYEIPPIEQLISLSVTNSIVIIDTGLTHFVVFEAQNSRLKNFTFEILSSNVYGAPVFDNENLTKSLSNRNCFGSSDKYRCIVEKSKFALFAPEEEQENGLLDYPFLAVEFSQKGSHGCLMKKTTFLMTEDTQNFNIGMIAASAEDCIIHVLIDSDMLSSQSDIRISHLFTTSVHENVKVYDGAKLFFEFNSSSSKKWNDISLYSSVYKIIIPKSSASLLYLNYLNDYSDEAILVEIETFPYYSIVATPNYGTSKMSYLQKYNLYEGYPFVTYIIGNYSTTFAIINSEFVTGDVLIFQTDDDTFSISATTTSLTFRNQIVSLYYNCENGKSIESGYLMSIETSMN